MNHPLTGERIGVLYGLLDPATLKLRYVGVTYCADGPDKRYRQHLSSARNPRTPCAHWIASLAKRGLKPSFVIFADTYSGRDMYEMEVDIIARQRAAGTPLLNVTPGGRGGGIGPKSAEHAARISAGLKGKPKPPRTVEWRASHAEKMRGKKHSPETLAKMRESVQRRVADRPESLKPRFPVQSSCVGCHRTFDSVVARANHQRVLHG